VLCLAKLETREEQHTISRKRVLFCISANQILRLGSQQQLDRDHDTCHWTRISVVGTR